MDSHPTVSAVIPVFNGAAFVADAIESALAQNYPSLEIVVVNDGSTDATRDVLQKFGARIRVIEKANGGVASARNAGIAAASGDWIAFLDADDVWLPGKIPEQVQVALEQSADLVYSPVLIVDEALRTTGEFGAAMPEDALSNTLLLEPPGVVLSTTGLARSSLIRELGGFDSRLSTSADADLVCRLAVAGRLARIDRPLALYRQHASQMHLSTDAMERDMHVIFEKFFADGVPMPEAIHGKGRRARANLHATLALARARKGQWMAAARDLRIAGVNDPMRSIVLLTAALRRRVASSVVPRR